MDTEKLPIDQYLAVAWSRIVEMVGGLDSPMEFRDTMRKFIDTGKLPDRKKDKGDSGKPGSKRPPSAPRANMKGIQDLMSQMGRKPKG